MKLKKIMACVLAAACLTLAAGCGDKTNSDSAADSSKTDSSTPANSAADIGEISGNVGDITLESGDKIAVFEIEGYGTIKAKLLPDVAPTGVENFIKLADSGFYDGLTIHRVIEDFMLQGGSLNGDGTGGEAADGGSFGVEVNDSARHFYGALCYANAAGQNTCQFYIVNNKQPQNITEIDLENIEYAAAVYGSYKDMCEEGTVEYSYYNAMETYYAQLADMITNASDEVKAKYLKVGGTPSLDGGYTVFGQVYEGFDVLDAISACEVEYNANDELSKPVSTITITSVRVTEYTESE